MWGFFFLSLLVILFFINDFEREHQELFEQTKKKTPETGLLLLLHGLLKQFIQEM